jgi:hypothetical protein
MTTIFPAPTALPEGVTIEQQPDGYWQICAEGSPYGSRLYQQRDEAEATILGWTAIDEAERLIAPVVGDWGYGIHVWLGEPSWAGGPRTWRRTDRHTGQDAFAFAWYSDQAPPVDVYTRTQYEAACGALGLPPAPDASLGSYGDMYGQFAPPEYPARTVVEVTLRRRRLAGLEREAPAGVAAVAHPVVTAADAAVQTTQVADVQATQVAEILGLPAPSATGRCHYCGCLLDRHGRCPECV